MNKPSKKNYRLLNNNDVSKLDFCLNVEECKKCKRQIREPILQAFDSYKTSVLYEGKEETKEKKDNILIWKQRLLDLETDSFEKIPDCVKYYLKKNII